MSTPACAEETRWGDGVEVLQDDEMKDLSGGFKIGDIDVNFAIIVTTFMNGNPVVTTNLTVNDQGALLEHTIGDIGQNIANMSPEALAALGLSGLAGAHGVVIDDAEGVTALAHNVTDGSLQNIIVNTASGRDLAQNIDLTIDLHGFEAVQNSINTELFGIHLADDFRGYLN